MWAKPTAQTQKLGGDETLQVHRPLKADLENGRPFSRSAFLTSLLFNFVSCYVPDPAD